MAKSKPDKFNPHAAALARYAKALSHPARIAIVETLAKRASCICGEIVEEIPLAQSTVSQHLKELKEAQIIRGEIDGPRICYCLHPEAIQELEGLLTSLLKSLKKSINSKKRC